MTKERLDVLLVERQLIDTREKAKRLIMAGQVYSENIRLDKAGTKYENDIPLNVKGSLPFVSRGGLKLEKALKEFDISVTDKTVVDIGASTGGFSDCALQNGAKLIYAIDVGYNQLDWKIRSDKRVIVMEKTNFRYVTTEVFTKGLPEFAMIDVSFISLSLILPVLKEILKENSDVVTLIKPQFEAMREEVGKKGIIRDPRTHEKVLMRVVDFISASGYSIHKITHSPIAGGEGNIEFLAHLSIKTPVETPNINIKDIVRTAHDQLTKKN